MSLTTLSALANARILELQLAQVTKILSLAREYTGLELQACPLCVYKEGKFISYCTPHAQLAQVTAERDRLLNVANTLLDAANIASGFIQTGNALAALPFIEKAIESTKAKT